MSDFDTYFTAVLAFIIIIVGLGLGADSTFDDFRSAFKKPRAVMVGIASQYGFMPLCAFLLARSENISEYTAIGIVLVGGSPGGTTSNLFTMWSKGDVPLSITMSFCSTVAAFFMMPIIILVYVQSLSKENIKVPWANIFISVFLIVLPTVIGLYIRKYNTTKKIGGRFIWDWLRIATSVFGGTFVLVALVAALVIHMSKLKTASVSLWMFAFAMEPMGALFGYCASKVSGLTLKDHRTIAIECGIQNFTFAMVVISLSFGADSEETKEAILFPIMYGIAYLFNSSWLVVFFRADCDLYVNDKVASVFYYFFPSYNPETKIKQLEASKQVELKKTQSPMSGTSKKPSWELSSDHQQAEEHHIKSVIPAQVDKKTAKRLAGHLFDEEKFDMSADVETGMISREQFIAKCHEKRGVVI